MAQVIDFEKIYHDSFGQWTNGIFFAISGNYPEIDFLRQKETYFSILTKWLNESRIVFCTPENPLSEVWKAETAEIISYLKERWPMQAKHKDDSDLNYYFFEIPAMLWVKDDGTLIGS